MHFYHNENKLEIDTNSLPANLASIRAMALKWATRGRCVPIPGSFTASPILPHSRSWWFLEGAKSTRVLETELFLAHSFAWVGQPQSCTALWSQIPQP